MYTEQQVMDIIFAQHLQGKSLRTLANEYGPPITYGDISRALKGKFSKRNDKRCAFGLPALAPAPVCPRCGVPHVTKRCTATPRQPRRKIYWRDPQYCRVCLKVTPHEYTVRQGLICRKCGEK